MGFVVMKKGGKSGTVAINPDKVTHVRSTSALFTDIYFGEQHVSVEGSFQQVVSMLSGQSNGSAGGKTWFKAGEPARPS